jgi:hypothetical protein
MTGSFQEGSPQGLFRKFRCVVDAACYTLIRIHLLIVETSLMSKIHFAGSTLLAVIGIGLFTLLSAADPAEAPKKYALLVGVNVYDHGNLEELKWAANDAVELRDVLGSV